MPQAASWAGAPSIKGSSESVRMALLTFSLVGLQFTWGIEMTYCTPYLLQLGLTKSKTSLVWIAGPLSGLIMGPVVGVLADNSKSKYGRRRPFMIGGAIIVSMGLLVLGWTAEIVGFFIPESELRRLLTITLAVFSIYLVDFAINAIQSSCRSLIVDTLPIPKQQKGSAWATRMIAVGHLAGYGVSTVDLLKILGKTLGDSQFKQCCVIAAGMLLLSVGITSWAVDERILISLRDADVKSGAWKLVGKILSMAWHLPDRIRAICWVQFWAWIGWFPFLFYSTTWVGETYFRYTPEASITESTDPLGDIGRIGSLSLLIFSIVTFIGSVLLPFVVRSPDNEAKSGQRNFTPRPPPALAPLAALLKDVKPDLLTSWMLSHLIFAGAMFLTPFVRSLHMATVLVSICGIPWALACWAPFAYMGIEVNRMTAPSTILANGSSYRRLPTPSDDFSSPGPSPSFLRLNHLDRDIDDDEDPDTSTGETAGIYLGILNLFSTLPQFVGTFISMIVFEILEPGKHPELHKGEDLDGEAKDEVVKKVTQGPNAIAVCLFIGAISAVGAAYATRRMKRMY
ncbi:MAG: hypothetical protein LQ343_004219 [Gyalolechia ehrenbergii]|nr:MAG: hypothetical protein LQ343_004219 [Gyalolechia ehrenbergii]